VQGYTMRNAIHKFGKFYSNIMINMIGIFIFVGILSVIFGDYGWAPNENIYAISQFVYSYVIPALIAYAAGNHMGQIYEKRLDVPKTGINHAGGAIAVMAAAGIMIADKNCAILGAMILGPICGLLWKHVLEPLTRKAVQGMEMLTRNLVAAIVGAAFSIAAYYVLTPVLSAVTHVIMMVVDWLIAHKLICLTSVLIEPAKVFFLNNSIHHGILLPLAMQQAEQNGSSMLFLLETNPGPGLGVLLALWLSNRKKRKEYAAYMFVECIGGIHEIYFPEVLANLWLLLALIPGGMAGILCMSVFHVASAGLISPGSILTLLFMSGHHVLATLFAVAISTAVSCAIAFFILKRQGKWCTESAISVQEEKKEEVQEKRQMLEKGQMLEIKIGFICDAGVGSSAMGAALFRRKLKEEGMDGITAEAYAVDQIPEDLTIGVCQRAFLEILQKESNLSNIVTMESLLNQTEHLALIEKLRKGDITQ
jgi:PTS system mannitol-specific IIC component